MTRSEARATSVGSPPPDLAREETRASLGTVARRWSRPSDARRYRDGRWRSARAGGRDPSLVRRILEQHGVEVSRGGILDAPCGTGRLRPTLEARGAPYVGVDVSASMLRPDASGASDAAGAGGAGFELHGRVLRAAVESLPFGPDTFDVVVSCRLLHHVHEREDLEAFVRELVRVSNRLVVASFWDQASLHAWRRRVGLRRGPRPEGRRAVAKAVLRRLFEQAGAPIVGFHHSFRFVSQQTFLVAHKGRTVRRPARAARAKLPKLDVLQRRAGIDTGGALGQA